MHETVIILFLDADCLVKQAHSAEIMAEDLNQEENSVNTVLTFDSCDENEDGISLTSTTTDTTSRSQSGTPTIKLNSGKKVGHNKVNKKIISGFVSKYVFYYLEDHGNKLFGVAFNYFMPKGKYIFASAGSNRVTIYECLDSGSVQMIQCYADPDASEVFYTCAWTISMDDKSPILAAAGFRGVIRVFNTNNMVCLNHFIGHGHAINELKFNPKKPHLLLSASKDHSIRLWNIKSDVCVAIFGGVEGHRDQVLSVDFDWSGTRVMSAGMDHSLKLWRLDKEKMQEAIEKSENVSIDSSFKTISEHFPDFSTRDIHRNYVDCVRWYGDLILSKSCENSIVLWKLENLNGTNKRSDFFPTVLHRFLYKKCGLWFIRFALDYRGDYLALGSETGKVFFWELNQSDTAHIPTITLSHPKCTSTVRQTSFSQDGKILISCCDDGTIWRWDRK